MIAHLLPRPRTVTVDDDGTDVPVARLVQDRQARDRHSEAVLNGAADSGNVLEGTDRHSEAWALLAAEHPEELAVEGYVLRIRRVSPSVLIAATGIDGIHRARVTLAQLIAGAESVPELTIRDEPQLARRGVVEGFYGTPWTHRERCDFLSFAGRVGLNEYIYAPKDDPYHRERWAEPYPDDQLATIAALAAEAGKQRVRFVYAVSPALSMRFADARDHEALAAKAEQLWSAGVRAFALLFDDVPAVLPDAGDRSAYGTTARATGLAHGTACARFQELFLKPHGMLDPVTMCPTDYAGIGPAPYRDGLAETLPHDAIVMWTGSDIVVGEITRADIDAAASSYGRRLLLWDNFPVNDFDRSRLFLGPLLGRTTDLAGSALVGIAANPMVEAAPSRFALAAIADWGWNPARYEPAEAAALALDIVAGEHADSVRALVAACSSWPPSASQSPGFDALADAALAGDVDALTRLEVQFSALAAAGTVSAGRATDDALLHALEPWLAAARDAGTLGAAACALLRAVGGAAGSESAPQLAAVLSARTSAEGHYANVLRSTLSRFVRAVLERAGVERIDTARQRSITILAGPDPLPGDRDLAERLASRGFRVAIEREDARDVAADLLIITPATSVTAAKRAAVADAPILAWGRLDTLGLSVASGVHMGQHEIDVTSPGHPLAAGLEGTVVTYRGPGAITWCEPVDAGEVIARSTRGGDPVIVHFPAGAALGHGIVAPAARISFLLGDDGLAPWLMARHGHDLFTAAVGWLLQE